MADIIVKPQVKQEDGTMADIKFPSSCIDGVSSISSLDDVPDGTTRILPTINVDGVKVNSISFSFSGETLNITTT